MQVTETKSEGLKREFRIVVPAADIDDRISKRLEEMARTVRMPGFRPGKVPVSLLRKQHGASLTGEMLERTVTESSQAALSERGMRPALEPRIEITAFEDGTDLEFTMALELMPEIEPIDFAGIELEQMLVETDEAEVESSLERLAKGHSTTEPIAEKRKSVQGDVLVIDFVGRVDGVEFPGGKGEDYPLELGTDSFIPGFEDGLIGAMTGDQVDVGVTFPDNYGNAELAGKPAVFTVEVKELRRTVPVPVDDELAARVGLDSLEELKKAIRDDFERDFRMMSRARLKRSLLDLLSDRYDFEVPEGLAEKEFSTIWDQFEERRKDRPESIEDEFSGKTDDEIKEEFQGIAERRVRLALALSEIGRLNNLQVVQDEINRAMAAEARRYPGQEKKVMDHLQGSPEAMESLAAPLFEDKVVDFILEMATVTNRTVSVEELIEELDDRGKAPTGPGKKKKAPGRKTAVKTKAAKTEKKAKAAGKPRKTKAGKKDKAAG